MKYTFNDIAGYAKEKEELKRLCEIFKNAETYLSRGAKLPKGVIFYGPAGTGKTLFAKVLANECGREMLCVDLGEADSDWAISRTLKRVFKRARKSKEPTVIFFDELDKVLPNAREEYYTDVSKTVLAQLLTLIDGMEESGNIIFVATCNDYATLPSTLTRPGRIDKKIFFGTPDAQSRKEIVAMYMGRASCRFACTVEEICELSEGFSCAALETLVNECVLQADADGVVDERLLRAKCAEIKNEDIARERPVQTKEIEACRSLGAFVIGQVLCGGSYTLDIDHNSVCNDFLNGLISDYDGDYSGGCDKYYSKEEYLNAVTALLGGRAAQELIFGRVYDNLGSDLSAMENVLEGMATNGIFGLSLRYLDWRSIMYTSAFFESLNECLEKTVEECYQEAKGIVAKNRAVIEGLLPVLAEQEKIKTAECEAWLKKLGGIRR